MKNPKRRINLQYATFGHGNASTAALQCYNLQYGIV